MNEEILKLHNGYRAYLKLANETDSKATDQSLKNEAAKLLIDLCEKCDHDEAIVILYSEYKGSLRDWDEGYPESRICLCCGIKESSYVFKFLTGKPIARFEDKYPDQIIKPLLFPLSEAKEIALSKGFKI